MKALLSLLLIIGVLFLLKRLLFPSLGTEEARRLLVAGAPLVDVRTRGEFQQSHLPGARNIPLASLAQDFPRNFPDKSAPVLLHCLSGSRSALAVGQLKHLGYTRVYNLGSLSRAARLAAPQPAPASSRP